MKFSSLHKFWTAALPDTLSRGRPPELRTQKKYSCFSTKKFAKDETSSRLECKNAVENHSDKKQICKLKCFQFDLESFKKS